MGRVALVKAPNPSLPKALHYPNGRTPTDVIFSLRLAFTTNGQTKRQPIKPHQDLLPEFPFYRDSAFMSFYSSPGDLA